MPTKILFTRTVRREQLRRQTIWVFKGAAEDALFKGEIRITSGLGMINNVIIDTHFVKRGRIYDGEAISINGLTVHVMSKYDKYNLDVHDLTVDHSNNDEE